MVCDDACFGVPDLRRREQGLLTVDALDGINHPRALPTGGKGAGAMSSLTTLEIDSNLVDSQGQVGGRQLVGRSLHGR